MAVEILRRVVLSRPRYELAWIARDGAEAVTRCSRDLPDLILMDLIMPGMDGVEATRRIMRDTPCAVLLVTATVAGNADKVFDAMGAGALDVIATPVLGSRGEIRGGKELLAKIARIARLIQKPSPAIPGARGKDSVVPVEPLPPLVAIGASAGGPRAVAGLLEALPENFGSAMVVIQHVDADFGMKLVDWLRRQTSVQVRSAEEGTGPAAGVVLVAVNEHHLVLGADLLLSYSPEPLDSIYRPSIDVFFDSLAAHWKAKGLAILLTGMGRDGARGLLHLRRAGWHTIAQDEKSSTVFGMPKAAIELGAAVEVLPLSEIPGAILKMNPLRLKDPPSRGATELLPKKPL